MSLLERFLEKSRALLHLTVESDGSVSAVSPTFRERLGVPAEAVPGAGLQPLLAPEEWARVEAWLAGDVPAEEVGLRFLTAGGRSIRTRCVVAQRRGGIELLGELDNMSDAVSFEELTRLNNELAVLARERARRERRVERARSQAEATLTELETSFWHLRKIQEVLPVCMGCGKLRTGPDRWLPLVEYLRENDILVSHGFCPPCADDWARREGLEGDGPDT